jgi:hypothetical protein
MAREVAQTAAAIFKIVALLPRVIAVLFEVEANRRLTSPQRAARAARRRALRAPTRSPEARERLCRAIALVDRWMPGGANCLRRSLLEMSLDAGAAREKLLAGFKAGGGRASGHAWLESHAVTEQYDAVISI